MTWGGDTGELNEYGIIETEKQKPIRRLIIKGYTNQEIADKLDLSLACVKYHVGNILKSWSVPSRTRLVAKVQRLL